MKSDEASSLLPDLPHGSKILIVRLRSLGDLVLETPVIAALHAWRPDLQIHVLTEPRFAAVFEGNPAVAKAVHLRGFFETMREMRQQQFGIVFNQHGGPRSAVLTAASGAEQRVCWKGFQFSLLYNVLVPDAKEFYGKAVVHTVEHRISQFYWTGMPRTSIAKAQVFPQADAIQVVEQMLAEHGIEAGAPYAVLQPGARIAAMRWPVEKFAEVARWLWNRHKIRCVVNLAPGDAEVAADVRSMMRDCCVIPDPVNVRELIALVARVRILIGNDSGPVHVAAATGRPVVAIYGPTNPAQWHPWQTDYRVFHTGAAFDPKRGDKSFAERELRPISAIAVEEVCAACEELLAR